MAWEVLAFALVWVGHTLFYHERMRRAMSTMPMQLVGPLISMFRLGQVPDYAFAFHD